MDVAEHDKHMLIGLESMAKVLGNWCDKMDQSMGMVKETTILEVKMTSVEQQLEEIKCMITKLPDTIANQYVSKEEFKPVKVVAYGFIGLIVSAVGAGLIDLVLR